MRPREVAFTRTVLRQLAGLGPAARAALREALRTAAPEKSSTPPIAWLTVDATRIAIVEGDDRRVVLKLGAEPEGAMAVLRALATGREERVAERTLDRLMDGENPVKVWREHRGLTQARLAELAGINPDYLSQIETGKRHASDQVTSDLLRALGLDALDLGLLVELPGRKKKRR